MWKDFHIPAIRPLHNDEEEPVHMTLGDIHYDEGRLVINLEEGGDDLEAVVRKQAGAQVVTDSADSDTDCD